MKKRNYNDENIRKYKIREILRIAIIIFSIATIAFAIANLFFDVSIVFAIVTCIVTFILNKVRDNNEIELKKNGRIKTKLERNR